MPHRHVFLLLVLAAITGALGGCAGKPPADNKPWDYPWTQSENPARDGRELLGVYDLQDPTTGKTFEVFLLFDNGTRQGEFDPQLPYKVFAFHSTDGETWTPTVVARGKQSIGLTQRATSATCVLLTAQPYYADYTKDTETLREQVHAPHPVTLTIQNGLPSLDRQGPPAWEVKTRHAPYDRHGTVFTGTVKAAEAWGFASYTEELPMTYYYLQLDRPVAFDRNVSPTNRAEPSERELHLVPTSDDQFEQLRTRLGQRVTVVGSCFHGHTAYHRRSVVVSVDMLLDPLPAP
ncbi:MAG: DUF4431 domain-containing protein [Phycisphaeraceae bacterium]